jgi:LCP family protein required for cell wall assembly
MAAETERSLPLDRLRASVTLPALASFLWPGAGHWILGARRIGLLLAIPQLALLVAVGIGLANGGSTILGWLLDPLVLVGLIGFNLVLLLSRAYAIAGSTARASAGTPGRASLVFMLVLVVLSVAIHGEATRMGWSAYETLTTVFSPTGPQGGAFGSAASPSPSPTPRHPVGPLGTPEPLPTPEPRPDWAADGRLNLLLVGSDAGPGRWKLRTDTMILLSVDIETGRAALIGVPRNVRFAPMPPPLDATFPNGYPDLLNALWVWVEEHPGSFPGDPAIAPFDAVQETIGLLTGLDVDAMAVAELNGFVQAVDALGGLDMTIPSPVYDARYPNPDGTGFVELYLPAGPQHLDGWHALAYARTRHQDSDYQRMQRQQSVLVALQRQLRCGLAFRITELLGIARDTVWTNLPLDGLARLVGVMGRVDPDEVTRLTLAPPAFSPNLDATTIDRIRAAVQEALAGAIASPTPSPSASGEPSACD